MTCEACHAGAPKLTTEDIDALHEQVPEWNIVEREGVLQLERVYTCKDFREALHLTNRIGELAETHDHHPAIRTEWGRVVVTWWTHAINGLHRNDFIMAAKTDAICTAR